MAAGAGPAAAMHCWPVCRWKRALHLRLWHCKWKFAQGCTLCLCRNSTWWPYMVVFSIQCSSESCPVCFLSLSSWVSFLVTDWAILPIVKAQMRASSFWFGLDGLIDS